jgi:hypothetical protein
MWYVRAISEFLAPMTDVYEYAAQNFQYFRNGKISPKYAEAAELFEKRGTAAVSTANALTSAWNLARNSVSNTIVAWSVAAEPAPPGVDQVLFESLKNSVERQNAYQDQIANFFFAYSSELNKLDDLSRDQWVELSAAANKIAEDSNVAKVCADVYTRMIGKIASRPQTNVREQTFREWLQAQRDIVTSLALHVQALDDVLKSGVEYFGASRSKRREIGSRADALVAELVVSSSRLKRLRTSTQSREVLIRLLSE